MEKILDGIRFVADNSEHVQISHTKLVEFIKTLNLSDLSDLSITNILDDFQFRSKEERLKFILYFNSLHFAFWGEPRWKFEHNQITYEGAFAMVHCLKSALEDNPHLFDYNYLSSLSLSDFYKLLKKPQGLLFIPERWRSFREVSDILNYKYNNSINAIFEESQFDATKLINTIAHTFLSFDDNFLYKNTEVSFYKRAQLVVFMWTLNFPELDIKNVHKLTCFADYRIPQLLRHMQILEYSKNLSYKIDNQIMLRSGSPEEVEIRANTVWTVELIKNEIYKMKNKEVTACELDNYLWILSKSGRENMKPHHLTETIYY